MRRCSEARRDTLVSLQQGHVGNPRGPIARAGWNDLPGELHREILRLVPLCDATAARAVSQEMREEVDEVWSEWGICATEEEADREGFLEYFVFCMDDHELKFGPFFVATFGGSHAHHLASLGLWWLAVLVTEEPDMSSMSWEVLDENEVDQSPLMAAVRARPVGRGTDGEMEWAYALGDEEVARMVRAAVGMGADVNRRLQGARPLMTYCAMRGCLEAVKACLAAGAEVDSACDDIVLDWWTALVHAAFEGHEAVVEALLEAGASAQVGEDGLDQTMAAVCCVRPTPGVVRRLAEAGAAVDVPCYDEDGDTPLLSAAGRGNVGVVEALLELGANMASVNTFGLTAMYRAGTRDVVRLLAARGVSVQGDGVRDSPLQVACQAGHIDAARGMLERGADVHYCRKSGMALHYAVQFIIETWAVEMTHLLLAAGADPNAANRKGQTALHMVRHARCVDLLVDAGADLEARDRRGRTPHRAAITDSPCMVEVAGRLAERLADRRVEQALRMGGQPG